MENLTKAKINIKEGTLELEGSEEFVEKYLNSFVDGTLQKWKAEEDKEIETDSDVSIARIQTKLLREIIRKLQGEYKGAASLKDIISLAEKYSIKKDMVEDMMQKLKSAGEIIEVSNERFRVV